MSREIVNSVLLLWGSLFCAVSSLYFLDHKILSDGEA